MIQRIAFSTDSLARGGKERQMALLARSLIECKFIFCFIAKRTDSGNNYLGEYGLSGELVRTYSDFTGFRTAVRDFRPDIVVSWDARSSFFNLLLHRRLHYVFINGSIRHGIWEWKPDHLLRAAVCRLSPFVMANSFAGLRANRLKPGRNRFVLYNGVDQDLSPRVTPAERERLKDAFIPGYLKRPGMVFISVANLVPYKDYHTVIRALSRVKQQRDDFWYLIAGDGPMKDEIFTAIRDQGLEENVMLLGRRHDIAELLRIPDVFIHSSRGEGISNAILEAMQAGLPVIASDVGGVEETVYRGTSLLFPYGDDEILAERIYMVLGRSVREETESEAYKNHLNRFSTETMVTGFLDILKAISGRMQLEINETEPGCRI